MHRILTFSCVVLASAACAPTPRAPTSLVLIVADTLRADLGGADTPHLDALAADGVSFPLAFSHAPLTLPAHTALFTARLPGESRVTSNGQAVGAELPLLAERLAEEGYRPLAATSLATLWPPGPGAGLDRGFEGYAQGARPVSGAEVVNAAVRELLSLEPDGRPLFLFAHYSDPHQPYRAHGTARVEARVTLDGAPLASTVVSEGEWWQARVTLGPGEHALAVDADAAVHLRAATLDGEPLELPHGPPDTRHVLALAGDADGPREHDVELWLHDAPDVVEIRRRYRLEVETLDRALGDLLDDLRARGLYDRSLIVFTSDHGEGLGEHGAVGHARHLYDELLHVPLIVKPPARHPRAGELRASSPAFARHVDVVPTVLDLLGLPPWPGAAGNSLLAPAPRVLVAEAHPPEAPRPLYALRNEHHKLVLDALDGRFELYDLDADPAESTDAHDPADPDWEPWRERLRALARGSHETAPLDPDVGRRLRALGY